jgi:hypothetical protein
MTAREIIEQDKYFRDCYSLMLPIKENVIEFAEAYAKLMCDKQREICAKDSKIEQEFTLSFGEPSKYIVDEAELNNYRVSVNKNSILNAPYPEELEC